MKNTMTGERMKEIRARLCLTRPALGKALGYSGKTTSLEIQIMRFEHEHRDIPIQVARLMVLYDAYGVPERFLR